MNFLCLSVPIWSFFRMRVWVLKNGIFYLSPSKTSLVLAGHRGEPSTVKRNPRFCVQCLLYQFQARGNGNRVFCFFDLVGPGIKKNCALSGDLPESRKKTAQLAAELGWVFPCQHESLPLSLSHLSRSRFYSRDVEPNQEIAICLAFGPFCWIVQGVLQIGENPRDQKPDGRLPESQKKTAQPKGECCTCQHESLSFSSFSFQETVRTQVEKIAIASPFGNFVRLHCRWATVRGLIWPPLPSSVLCRSQRLNTRVRKVWGSGWVSIHREFCSVGCFFSLFVCCVARWFSLLCKFSCSIWQWREKQIEELF